MKTHYLLAISCLISGMLCAQTPTKVSRNAVSQSSTMPYDAALKPFYHGVASGDPLEDKVIIWTRVTPETDQTIAVDWKVATDTSFTNIVKTGNTTTDINKDYTVKIDVTGLQANTTYYYYFSAFSKNSIMGRTKTLPSENSGNNVKLISPNVKLAVISCANYEGGLFNAYNSLSQRNDLDAILHLGDYIYEYAPGKYKNAALSNPQNLLPANEILSEADYRTRYGLYRLDENLRKAHQQHPFITIWDDHESANDSYMDGAENHDSNTEGDWQTRKAISKKVYFEWMPIREEATFKTYRSLKLGNLAEIFMLDTRLEGRVKPPVNFDDADVPARNIISNTQFDWLTKGLKSSTAKWKVIGNQVLFSTFNVGFGAGAGDGKPDITNIDSIRVAENSFIDNWESYPTQRNSIIDTLKKNNIKNTIIVSGDSHCSWAFDVTKNPVNYPSLYNLPFPNAYNSSTGEGYDNANKQGSYAVEFGTPSISSQNFDEIFPINTVYQFEYSMNNPIPIPGVGNVNYNPHLEYVDLKNHGYFILDLKSDSAQADYFFQSSILSTTSTESFAKAMIVKDNVTNISKNKLASASAPKSVQQIPAPLSPIHSGPVSVDDKEFGSIFTLYPNPASDVILINFSLLSAANTEIVITDLQGKVVKTLVNNTNLSAGIYQSEYNISDIKSGLYLLSINSSKGKITRKLTVK